MRRGPLADSYPSAVALVVFSLIPFLSLTAAVFPMVTVIGKSLGIATTTLDVTLSLSTAGYAVGTVLAVQLATHFPARRLLLVYETAFVVSAVLAAWAPTADVFLGAFVTEGLCTSLMLIAAVPPLIIGWPPERMPVTGAVMNLAIFGAVAIGPTVGAVQAASGSWRPLFWGVAAVAFLALLFSVLTFEDAPPQDTSAPWDVLALVLAVLGCAAAFFGAGVLEIRRSVGPLPLVPLLTGAVLVTVLVVNQYRKREPLMPVRQLATVFPVAGITIAMSASAAAFGLMELVLTVLVTKAGLVDTALLFLPEFAAAVVTAGLFGALFRTRFTPVLAFAGMAVLAGAAALLVNVATEGNLLIALGTWMVGLGVGASVSPALFLAGFSLRSHEVQRVFALIELLRGVTAFLVAPILIYLVVPLGGGNKAVGIRGAIWICLGIAVVGGLVAFAVLWRGGGRLQAPDLGRWQQQDEPAWESPPLARPRDDAAREEGEQEEELAAERR
ncbi:MAG: MFS transporter [Acidimicrobiales bacterium]